MGVSIEIDDIHRAAAGIAMDEEAILANPYALAEFDLGSKDVPRISVEAVDHALLPAAGVAPEEPIGGNDDRRVRAALSEVLRSAAADGDTLLPLDGAIERHIVAEAGEERVHIRTLNRDEPMYSMTSAKEK